MSDQDRHEDERLERLLASVRAEADPALWTRVRARIEAGGQRAGVLAWIMRPAALGAACALLLVCVAASAALMMTSPRTITAGSTGTSQDLTEALVAELGDVSVSTSTFSPATPATVDSGASR
jgi:hypothetical protein